MQNNYKLYAHVNIINNKIYFGITRRKLSYRSGKYGDGYITSPYFYSSIRKYGWDSFKHIVLVDNLYEYEAKEYEKTYIALFNTRDKIYGYNLTDGGDGSPGRHEISDKARESIKRTHTGNSYSKGHTVSIESRKIMREKKLGKKLTKEHINKIVEANKKSRHCKQIVQYDLDYNFIRIWRSAQDVVSIGLSPSSVFSCCRGDRKKYHDFRWSYLGKEDLKKAAWYLARLTEEA